MNVFVSSFCACFFSCSWLSLGHLFVGTSKNVENTSGAYWHNMVKDFIRADNNPTVKPSLMSDLARNKHEGNRMFQHDLKLMGFANEREYLTPGVRASSIRLRTQLLAKREQQLEKEEKDRLKLEGDKVVEEQVQSEGW